MLKLPFIACLTAIAVLGLPQAHAQAKKTAWQYKSGTIEIPAATADEPKMEFNETSVQKALKYLDDGAVAWCESASVWPVIPQVSIWPNGPH